MGDEHGSRVSIQRPSLLHSKRQSLEWYFIHKECIFWLEVIRTFSKEMPRSACHEIRGVLIEGSCLSG